jgi:hypothetical protein
LFCKKLKLSGLKRTDLGYLLNFNPLHRALQSEHN